MLICLYGGEVVLADRGLSERKGEGRKGGGYSEGGPKVCHNIPEVYNITCHIFPSLPAHSCDGEGSISAVHNACRL